MLKIFCLLRKVIYSKKWNDKGNGCGTLEKDGILILAVWATVIIISKSYSKYKDFRITQSIAFGKCITYNSTNLIIGQVNSRGKEIWLWKQ